jgi:predicted nucleic acid-binding Zn ribbon protein
MVASRGLLMARPGSRRGRDASRYRPGKERWPGPGKAVARIAGSRLTARMPSPRIQRPVSRSSAPGPPRRTARDVALAEWRGADWSAEERARAVGARAAAELVPRVVKELNLDRRRGEAEVLKAWAALVDPAVAAHARPTGIRRGTLMVAVDSSAWLAEIVRFRQAEILRRLQEAFGAAAVQRLSFRAG